MLFKNSFRDMKNVSIVDEKSDYEIRCKIIDSSMEFTWQKPYITTNEILVKTENDSNDQNEIKNLDATASPYVRKVGDIYSIQMGSYQDFRAAKVQAQRLKAMGLDVWIYQQ